MAALGFRKVTVMDHPPPQPIELPVADTDLLTQVKQMSGVDLGKCFHCRGCGPVCPVGRAMGIAPHGIIRMVQFGLRQELLTGSAIWICLGCHTCSTYCPMAINIAGVTDALRHLALAERAVVAEPEILEFHRQVLETVEHYGRTHKLQIMLKFKAKTGSWFKDLDVGLRMLAKRKLEIAPSRVGEVEEVRQLFGEQWRG